MVNKVYNSQNIPVNWGLNTSRKRGFFDLLAEITGHAESKR